MLRPSPPTGYFHVWCEVRPIALGEPLGDGLVSGYGTVVAEGKELREFEPDFFFDDQTGHVDAAARQFEAQMKMLQQTFNIYSGLKEQGKLRFAYAFADSPGGIIVLDMASNEELQQTLFLLPSMPLVNRTVRPLTEMKSVEDLITELESIVSSMPRKPSGKESG